MCWFLKRRLARQKKAAEQKAQSLKNSMVESFNKLSSSMSAVIGGSSSSATQPGLPVGKGPGAAGQRGTGRGAVRGAGRGGGKGAGRGAGRGAGKGPGRGAGKGPSRPLPPGVNTPLINPKGKPDKSKKLPANNSTKVKRKKKKQKKATGELLPEETSTLPSLCRFFKKPQRQQGASLPSKNFRQHLMCHQWEDDMVELDDIAEEDEEGH